MSNTLTKPASTFARSSAPLPSAPRLPSLDGWRALSIIFVLGSHAKYTAGFPVKYDTIFKWLFDGNLGVRFFFIISGFLITWLMLMENARHGEINLRHFYARRALRILPVYCAFLCALLGLQVFTSYRQSATAWIGNLTFTTNFLGGPNFTSNHLWSLAVEEQFYILWPGLFLLCGAATRVSKTALILITPILLAPLFRVAAYMKAFPRFLDPVFEPWSFFNYFDSIAVGCICAILFVRKRQMIQAYLMTWPFLTSLVALTLILIPYILSNLFLWGIFTIPLGNSFQAWGFAILLLQSIVAPQFGFYRILNWRLLREIGILSYSLYIWQQLFCSNPKHFGIETFWWMSFPGWLIPTFAVALLSYYGFERPLFKFRTRLSEA